MFLDVNFILFYFWVVTFAKRSLTPLCWFFSGLNKRKRFLFGLNPKTGVEQLFHLIQLSSLSETMYWRSLFKCRVFWPLPDLKFFSTIFWNTTVENCVWPIVSAYISTIKNDLPLWVFSSFFENCPLEIHSNTFPRQNILPRTKHSVVVHLGGGQLRSKTFFPW